MKETRREFIKTAGLAGAGIIVSGMESCKPGTFDIRVAFPADGDMLTENDGTKTAGGLLIPVRIIAPARLRFDINGSKPVYSNELYEANLLLGDYSNYIEVTEKRSGFQKKINVFRLNDFAGRYRFSLDDNIWFLKDIQTNSSIYRSIFENPYLGFLKQVHDTFATKIHINIYYQCEGFDLSQMTDRYKPEWKDNAGWLRLSFHALQNVPDKPYLEAGYDHVKNDCELVKEQIKRFAGEEVMGPVTTLHWGEAKVEGCRALRDSGYRALLGYFNLDGEGKPAVSYHFDAERTKHIDSRCIWRDNTEGIIYKKIHLVINSCKIDEIVPLLNDIKKDPVRSAFLDLMIHEQYFHKTYRSYQPDYREKVMVAMKWATDNGYKPSFLGDCIFS